MPPRPGTEKIRLTASVPVFLGHPAIVCRGEDDDEERRVRTEDWLELRASCGILAVLTSPTHSLPCLPSKSKQAVCGRPADPGLPH